MRATRATLHVQASAGPWPGAWLLGAVRTKRTRCAGARPDVVWRQQHGRQGTLPLLRCVIAAWESLRIPVHRLSSCLGACDVFVVAM
jgi:hypothetical protein